MNWKHGIIAALSAFALLMMFFFFKMLTHDSSYVPENYYQKGLDHEKTMNQESGAKNFAPRIETKEKKVIVFLDSLEADSGSLTMIWPPEAKLNYSVKLRPPFKDGYSAEMLGPSGFWNAQFVFYFKGNKYLFEKKIWVE
jgi:hypothetical protein